MNNNEPIVLGQVKKGKTGKPLLVLIIFLFIGAFLILLPLVNNYFEGYDIIELIKDGELISFIQNHEQYVNNSKEEKDTSTTTTNSKKNEVPVLINPKTVIEYNNFTINNFDLSQTNIEYTINTTTNINFDKSNYYLILTKDLEKITIKLTGEVTGSKTYNFKFINRLSTNIEVTGYIEEINESDYTNFNLTNNETGIASLKCKKGSETLIYNFNNNNLKGIQENYIYTKNESEDFNIMYQKYNNISNNIIILGGDSQLLQTQDGFILQNNIDLNIFNINQNTNYNYYSLNTQPKIINFEMKAKGYDCK